MKTFSVIIPTLNEENYIGSLLKDISQQSMQPKEVIVVDASSKDKTLQKVKTFKKVQLIEASPPVGYQRTLGGKQSSADILIFLDADVRLPKNFFKHVMDEMKAKKIDIACPKYEPYDSSKSIQSVYFLFNIVFFLLQKFLASGAGSCIIVKRKTFENMEGFDPIHTYDDIEFIRRVSKKYKFATLSQFIWVSDRRFKKYGVTLLTLQYILLSIFFCLGLFKLANVIKYQFGNYEPGKNSTTK